MKKRQLPLRNFYEKWNNGKNSMDGEFWEKFKIYSWIYIAGFKNYAQRFVNSLIGSTKKLEFFPLLGRVVPEFNKEEIREIIFYNYRIVYRNLKDSIEILSVVHSARDFERTFKKDWEI